MPRYIRVYRCPDCGWKWKCESKLGFVEPDCPQCGFHPDPLPDRVAAPAIVGTKAKAVDLAYDIVSKDYDLSNLRDGAREGDTAVILPPQPPQNIIAPNNVVQQAGGFIWGNSNTGQVQVPVAKVLQQAQAAAKLNDAQGVNPMQRLHAARPKMTAHSLGNFNRR